MRIASPACQAWTQPQSRLCRRQLRRAAVGPADFGRSHDNRRPGGQRVSRPEVRRQPSVPVNHGSVSCPYSCSGREPHVLLWLDLCPKPAAPRSPMPQWRSVGFLPLTRALMRCKAARRVIPRETRNPPVRHPPLRCGPAGAASIASGLTIAIEAAMVAGSETSKTGDYHG